VKILAIETSCDETAAAVVENTETGGVKVWGEMVASSEEMHVKTGGVVPEVAARAQMESVVPVVKEAIKIAMRVKEASLVKVNEWVKTEIEVMAVTVGPGLIGSLLVGVETAKAMALAWDKPLVPVNHLVGHLYAAWVETDKREVPELPALGLVVSGGHTDLVIMNNHQDWEYLGGTRDDAAGECLDKCARILGLPYPGGPNVANLASEYKGVEQLRLLPRPLWDSQELDYSFSGLKVAVGREVDKIKKEKGRVKQEDKARLAAELEEAVTESLIKKVKIALENHQLKSLIVVGGVAANLRLRNRLNELVDGKAVKLFLPELKYCTDNAVMVGAAALFHYSPVSIDQVKADPSLSLES